MGTSCSFVVELAAWPMTKARWEAQAVLVFELVAWLITDTKAQVQAVLVFELVT